MKNPGICLWKLCRTVLFSAAAAWLGWYLGGFSGFRWLRILCAVLALGIPTGWAVFTDIFGHWLALTPCGIIRVILFRVLASVVMGWIMLPVVLADEIRDLIRSLRRDAM